MALRPKHPSPQFSIEQRQQRRIRPHRVRLHRLLLILTSASAFTGCQPEHSAPLEKKSVKISNAELSDSQRRDAARKKIDAGQITEADRWIKQGLLADSESSSWLGLASRSALAKQEVEEAIHLSVQALGKDSKNADAASVITQLAVQKANIRQIPFAWVWRSMELTLLSRPQDDSVRRELISRLREQGCLHRACQHIDYLTAKGTATIGELHQIMRRRKVIDRPSESPLAQAIGHFDARNYSAGLQSIRPMGNEGWQSSEEAALYGKLLAYGQHFSEMNSWLSNCPTDASQYADYWSAIGVMLLADQKYELAASALLNAIDIDPTCSDDYRRLSLAFTGLNETELSGAVMQRAGIVDLAISFSEKLYAQESATFLIKDLAERLVQLGRPLESLRWREEMLRLQAINQSDDANVQSEAKKGISAIEIQRRKLLNTPEYAESMRFLRRFETLPEFIDAGNLQQWKSISKALAQTPMNVEREIDQENSGNASFSKTDSLTFEMADVASATGLDFTYLNRQPVALSQIRLHETIGGGIGVLDFDRDGLPDVFFGQGSGDLPDHPPTLPSQMFRNLGTRWREVTSDTMTPGLDYTVGVATGDLNQDGFADLVVGNFGEDHLFMNQGDGTFRLRDDLWSERWDHFTSSVVIADVNADGLSDIVEASYFDDPTVLHKIQPPRDGVPAAVQLSKINGGPNSLWIQNSAGRFIREDLESPTIPPENSLGIIVTDLLSATPGNEILVGNDMGPNQFWVRPIATSDLVEKASQLGLAANDLGIFTASMGLSGADFSGDGRMDIHITNFYGQGSSLFIQNEQRVFQDCSTTFGLDHPTYPMVGFGTQAADLNHDGLLEIAIVNGHIEDLTAIGSPFRMLPQVLARTDLRHHYQIAKVADTSGFWEKPVLGRAMVQLDWNADGRVDLITNFLDRPVALLENRSTSQGHWLRLELIGTQSERDPIGTRVVLRGVDDEVKATQKTAWRVAGGYLGSSENRIHLTCGRSPQISEFAVDVYWPSGTKQTFEHVLPDRELLLVEGQSIR
jgi:hypothetical protein